ncbi:MAG: type II secretion system F family protein [Lachnospiraceae bacterium]|nr:type II secretion system F family protein [Lachnospiraceae bacterium]
MQKDDINKQVKKRNSELISDYPEIVSKLLLLHGAGLTIQNAFSTILLDSKKTSNSKHYIYQEIELTLNKLKSGASESGAYAALGKRCHIHSYIKLGTLLEQNIKKGSSDLQDALNREVKEAFSLHKNNVLQAGEKAGTKMLFPMILILLVIMVIIIIPAFLSMNF